MNDETQETIKASVGTPNASRREIEVEVDAAETARELDRIVEEFTAKARLAGFRRGKAPKEMVKRLFYQEIREALIDDLAPRALRESLRRYQISPIGRPVIREVAFREGESFRFKADVEIIPDFDLPPYKKIRVRKRSVVVEDREVDQSLEELRQKSADYIPVEERGVKDGDYVVLESKGRDLKTKRFLPTEKILVLAGHPENEQALNESLIGLRLEETRRLTIAYPAGHPQKRLAGRTIEYEIKVLAIKEKRIPEAGDEWAKDLGEYESLAALREKIRQELVKIKEEEARREMSQEIIGEIVSRLEIDLPESLVAGESKAVLNRLISSLPPDLSPDQVEELKKQARSQAEKNLKQALLLTRIARLEKLTISDEEVEEEIRNLAARNNIPLSRMIESINREGGREDLKNRLLQRKAVDFLLQNAVLY